ncbi:MAG: YegS/Rv2252/BmrU family lipid kinase [Spirulinaceae cyanobacterium]
MSRTACLIFNPVAGQGDADQDLEKIKTLLDPKIDLDIKLTTKEVDAGQLAREAVARGVEAVIASGGDGTLSAAAEALVETDIPLGIISRGTANAFASALGIPDVIEEACQMILDGKTRVVDAAVCNDKPMVLLAGIGFEAETVKDTSRASKNRWGMLAYVLAGIKQLADLEAFEATIETEDKIIEVTATAITVANAAPPSSVLAQGPAGIIVDDGLLDLTLVAPNSRAGAVAASYHLLQTAFSNEAAERDDIGYLRAKEIKVTTNPPQQVVLDGELIGKTPVSIKCIPQCLTIFVPMTKAERPAEKLAGLPELKVEDK